LLLYSFFVCIPLLPIPHSSSIFWQLHMWPFSQPRGRPQLLIIPDSNLLRHGLLIYLSIRISYQLLLNKASILIIFPLSSIIILILYEIRQYMWLWIGHVQTMIDQTIYPMWLLFCFQFATTILVTRNINLWRPNQILYQINLDIILNPFD